MGQNVETLIVKFVGLYSKQDALEWNATSHYHLIYIYLISLQILPDRHILNRLKKLYHYSITNFKCGKKKSYIFIL